MIVLANDNVDKSQRKKAVLAVQSSVSILFSTRCISVGYEKGMSNAVEHITELSEEINVI